MPRNKAEWVIPGFEKDKDSGPIKKETHPLTLQSRVLQKEQKKGFGVWGCVLKAPVNIKYI